MSSTETMKDDQRKLASKKEADVEAAVFALLEANGVWCRATIDCHKANEALSVGVGGVAGGTVSKAMDAYIDAHAEHCTPCWIGRHMESCSVCAWDPPRICDVVRKHPHLDLHRDWKQQGNETGSRTIANFGEWLKKALAGSL